MKEERKPYYVRFMRLYKYLESKGYHYLYTRPDIKFPNRIVWIYDNTDDLFGKARTPVTLVMGWIADIYEYQKENISMRW